MMNAVIIDGKRHSFDSRKLDWKTQNPPAQFAFIELDGRRYFVKRQKHGFSGWNLLVQSLAQRQPFHHAPRIAGISRDGDEYYLFTEALDGVLLSEAAPDSYDPAQIASDVFVALFDVNRRKHWYSDLCDRNVMITTSGRGYLIDMDSCLPHSAPYSTKLPVSYQYAGLLGYYAKQQGIQGFRISNIPGEVINQSEALTMAVRLMAGKRMSGPIAAAAAHEWMKTACEPVYRVVLGRHVQRRQDWVETRKLLDVATSFESGNCEAA